MSKPFEAGTLSSTFVVMVPTMTYLYAVRKFREIRSGLSMRHDLTRDARATVDPAGVGVQTAIFHSASQFEDKGLEVTREVAPLDPSSASQLKRVDVCQPVSVAE